MFKTFVLFAVLWKTLITRYGGRVTEALDVSSLAKITDGYTPGHMAQAIQQILTERRLQQVGGIQTLLTVGSDPLARKARHDTTLIIGNNKALL